MCDSFEWLYISHIVLQYILLFSPLLYFITQRRHVTAYNRSDTGLEAKSLSSASISQHVSLDLKVMASISNLTFLINSSANISL